MGISPGSEQPSRPAPVRVGRFEWERLMMLSDLPEQDRFKLLAVGIFMGADGGRARPGNSGLAEFGPHADTWKKLLQRAVKAGWLVLLERGGARRGPAGTTVRKASVYAASVPYAVWSCREEILGGAPFRAAPMAVTDSPDSSSKGAPRDPLREVLKGVPEAPFEDAEDDTPSLEGGTAAPPSKTFEGGNSSFEGGIAAPPHHVPTSRIPTTAASSTAPDAPGAAGGGEDAAHEEQQRQGAADFLRDLPSPWAVGKVTAQALAPLLLLALTETGWQLDADLAAKLTEKPDGVRSPRAVLRIRIADLPKRPRPDAARTVALPDWCGQCAGGDPAAKTDASMRWTDTADGATVPCPECSLQVHRSTAA